MRRAVIDLGSNSVLLAVAELREGQWHPVYELSQVTGIGKGTKATGRLCAQGVEDSLAALRTAFEDAKAHGATQVVAAGTMALRMAEDTPEFLQRAAEQGTPVHVLSGDDEATLGFMAVANDPRFASESRLSMVDPGGHSTELVTADRTLDGWEVKYRHSFPVGALALREGPLREEVCSFPQLMAAVKELDATIGLEYRPHQCGHVVTLGATGTNLISIRQQLQEWDPEAVHGQVLDYEEISKAVNWLGGMTLDERRAIPGLEPGREHTLHAGALILERFLFALHALTCTVSVRGWRHALLEDDRYFA
ncbi:MAG: bifunctional 3-dehydroquinate synthase/phosphatase [Fimbriimonadaceae bacterium]